MPPKAKTVEPLGPPPARTSALCSVCPPMDLHPSTTHMSCPHGSWNFAPGALPAAPLSEADRAELLAGLDEDTLRGLLEAKTAETK